MSFTSGFVVKESTYQHPKSTVSQFGLLTKYIKMAIPTCYCCKTTIVYHQRIINKKTFYYCKKCLKPKNDIQPLSSIDSSKCSKAWNML